MSLKEKNIVYVDRCVNPLGKTGHIGKDLRCISKIIQEKYPNLPTNEKICQSCRKLIYEVEKSTTNTSVNNIMTVETEI